MSRFGWAYVNDVITGSGGTPGGSDKAIQFASGSTFSGSTNFTFDYTTNIVRLTGTLYADTLIVSSSTIYKSGSTKFGDDTGDTHEFTGSLYNTTLISGTIARFTTISGSVVSASTYYGLPTTSTTPGGSNTSIQFNSGSTFSGSSNLTYNYTTNNVSLTGALLMSGTSYISEVDYIDFDVSASIPAYKLGRMYYDTDTADLAYYLTYANQKLQLGQQTVVKVKNSTGSPISKGKLVQITGAVGDNPLINTASWENDNNSANTLGMLMSTVANGGFGYALLNGVITGVNTDPATYSEGQIVYLSSSGDYTNITPTAPKHTVRLGQVLRAHASVGSIFVKIDNGYELDELHNILITSASTGDLLTYNSSSALWTNTKSLTGSYAITGSLTISGSSTFTNIGPAIFSGTVNANNVISGTSAQFTDLTASVGRITTVIASTVTGSTARFTTISGSVISGSSFINVATGAATQVQYNVGLGLLGADSNFTSSSATKALTVGGSITTTTSSFTRLEGQVTGNLAVDSIVGWNNVSSQFVSSNIYKIGSVGTQAVISASNGTVLSGTTNLGTVYERLLLTSSIPATVNFDTTAQSTLYINNPPANFTLNFTNVSTTDSRVSTYNVIISQSATPYSASSVQVNTTASTVKWSNAVIPAGTANRQDVYGFSLIRSGSTWVTLGQLSSFG